MEQSLGLLVHGQIKLLTISQVTQDGRISRMRFAELLWSPFSFDANGRFKICISVQGRLNNVEAPWAIQQWHWDSSTISCGFTCANLSLWCVPAAHTGDPRARGALSPTGQWRKGPEHRLVSAGWLFWGKWGHEKHNRGAVCQSGVPMSAAGKGAR